MVQARRRKEKEEEKEKKSRFGTLIFVSMENISMELWYGIHVWKLYVFGILVWKSLLV